MPSDGIEIFAPDGTSVAAQAIPGLERARAPVAALSEDEIALQIEVIRLNLSGVAGPADVTSADDKPKPLPFHEAAAAPARLRPGHCQVGEPGR
jgi:hypothetical protein